MSLALTMPWPPSTNRLWRAVMKNRVVRNILSQQARDYSAAAARALLTQSRPRQPLSGRLHVELHLHAPTRRAYDIDNHAKAVLDALTRGGVWGDDSQIDRLLLVRCPPRRGGAVEVCVWPLP